MTTRAASSSLLLPGLFVVPVAEIPAVPHQCQQEGRAKASEHKGILWALMWRAYSFHGPLTDAEMAQLLGVERSTVNARRNEHAEIVPYGKKKNPQSGVSNTTWGIR